MSDNSTTVTCAGCGAPTLETPSQTRTPCPQCGSTARQFNVEITEELKLREGLKFKHKNPEGKTLAEGLSGDDLHRKSGKWMKKERLIDRAKDHYKEVVTDPDTGSVVHQCDEPLSQHRGHGSAKKEQALTMADSRFSTPSSNTFYLDGKAHRRERPN